ncbi:amino acid ABC transporter permease [Ornithinimicrobium cavernae]|uniref:amino acid ABC transporter permease n=1 Tax=Ornithinimicrobium cavernae TaxID=2666047 RepID=UPI000D6884E9|nr:amino acid ABC transporter permease [Ornithinimicrobium cavernae]
MSLLSDWAHFFPELWPGLLVSIRLTVVAMLIAVPLGTLLAVGASSSSWVRWPTILLVEVGRGMPGLVMLYLVYYGGPQIGVSLTSFVAASAGLGLTAAAYISEIIRAGLIAVPRGQREASRALGLTPWKEFRLVVLPQAIRIVIPPLIGYGIIVFQGTSLAFAISTPELLSRAYNAASITFQYTATLTLAGALYAAISLAVIGLTGAPRFLGRARSLNTLRAARNASLPRTH